MSDTLTSTDVAAQVFVLGLPIPKVFAAAVHVPIVGALFGILLLGVAWADEGPGAAPLPREQAGPVEQADIQARDITFPAGLLLTIVSAVSILARNGLKITVVHQIDPDSLEKLAGKAREVVQGDEELSLRRELIAELRHRKNGPGPGQG